MPLSADGIVVFSTTAEPSVGELRFIARLNAATIPTGPTASTIAGTSGAIEGSDVYLVSGQTRSKCKLLRFCHELLKLTARIVYSSRQFIDDQVHGVSNILLSFLQFRDY
jgi:rhamnogalacturonan endolyase